MTLNRVFTLGAVALVIAGLMLAFIVLGTPAHQRLISLDERRASDLERVATSLADQYHEGGLPAQLPESDARSDPTTGRPYGFHRINATNYVLCAAFATDGAATGDEQRWTEGLVFPREYWRHPAGRTCFLLDVTKSPPRPQRISHRSAEGE